MATGRPKQAQGPGKAGWRRERRGAELKIHWLACGSHYNDKRARRPEGGAGAGIQGRRGGSLLAARVGQNAACRPSVLAVSFSFAESAPRNCPEEAYGLGGMRCQGATFQVVKRVEACWVPGRVDEALLPQ